MEKKHIAIIGLNKEDVENELKKICFFWYKGDDRRITELHYSESSLIVETGSMIYQGFVRSTFKNRDGLNLYSFILTPTLLKNCRVAELSKIIAHAQNSTLAIEKRI